MKELNATDADNITNKSSIFVGVFNRIDMAKIKGTLEIDTERCKGCGVCIASCPCGVLAFSDNVNGKGYRYIMMAQPDSCTGCASCGIICPDSCIVVYRQKFE